MKKTLIILSTIITTTFPAFCGTNDIGTSSAVFLRMEQGARAQGMGGAFVAMEKDVESVWYNPAALSFTDGTQVNFSYAGYIGDITSSYAAFSVPAGANKNAAVIGDVNYISMGSVDARDATGVVTKTINLNNLVAGLGYSFPTAQNISFGFHAKYLEQNLGDYKANGFVGDIGLLYRMSEDLSLGVCSQNLGGKIKTSDIENTVPMDTRAGLAYTVSPKMILAVDEEMPSDSDNRFHIGSEYKMSDSFFLRAGYNSSTAVGFCAGAGFLTPVSFKAKNENGAWWKEAVDKDWKHNVIRIDYAYISSASTTEPTHRVSATLKF
jgi:hypothetical protein